VAGRLTGHLNGRPVVIEADESGLRVVFATWRGAWAMRGCAGALLPALDALRRTRLPLRAQVAGTMAVSLLPTPSWLARLIVPEVGRFD